MIDRRFPCVVTITLILLLATALTVDAQQPKKAATIGILTLTADDPSVGVFRQGLRELGYVEGQNLIIAHRFAEGQVDRLPALAAELVRLQVGAEGYQLLDWLHEAERAAALRALPAVEGLRQIWLQHYYRCTEPGLEVLRWRTTDEQPPAALLIQSPYDLDARYSQKRETQWVGYTVHLTETCDADQPDLMTQVSTTLATTSDFVMGPVIEQDLAARDLLPGTHLLDSGYVVADLLVSAQRQHQIDVVGPPLSSSSRQSREGHGYDLQAFVIDWDHQQASCPQGQRSVKWTSGQNQEGHPVIRIRFDRATCRACPTRSACTSSSEAPRQITVKPRAHHEAIQAARQRQETPEFKAQYALRAGVESSLSQGIRRFELRRSRYIGLARTHVQQTINATAMHIVRVVDWLREKPGGKKRRKLGHFALLEPVSSATGSLACAGGT